MRGSVLDSRKVRHAMVDSDLNQTQLANRIGADGSRVSAWLNGKGNPDLPYAVKLAKALGVPLDSLIVDSI